MRSPSWSSLCAALLGLSLAWTGASACGGNVIVDGAVSTGGTSTGTGTAGSATSTVTGIEIPDSGSPQCSQDYFNVVSFLESALGCTPTANIVQCSGSALLSDPCGCQHVANEAHPDLINFALQAWKTCESDGCCGPQATIGCSPCPPPPTQGQCDSVTSRCEP